VEEPTDAIDQVEDTITHFSRIYLGGIPQLITDETAFLSFILVLTATEALAGFRYNRTISGSGSRFNAFIGAYFPPEYHPFAVAPESGRSRLWLFRCRLVHGFSPAGFSLTHHHSGHHLGAYAESPTNPILNAEDFYGALLVAAQKYFREVRADPELQTLLIGRRNDREHGGPVGVWDRFNRLPRPGDA